MPLHLQNVRLEAQINWQIPKKEAESPKCPKQEQKQRKRKENIEAGRDSSQYRSKVCVKGLTEEARWIMDYRKLLRNVPKVRRLERKGAQRRSLTIPF
ncbi:hypothetical protein BELL_0017g00330 [Botrytis elliptica]|uniref:Uncharacterized protein n=1 Tax=Botrytis elliptica TaxID=278938 RepID=A0A4Z1K2J0_9HELO|nr:hypothetical protein BELL_0017g00330 [Botrytis elliptica]